MRIGGPNPTDSQREGWGIGGSNPTDSQREG